MEVGRYFAFLAAAIVVIVVPGPTNLTIVSDSIEAGVDKSVWTVMGAAISHVVFITAATAGVGVVLSTYPQAFVFIKWFGVVYLVFQAVRLIVRREAAAEQKEEGLPKRSRLRYLIKGFVVNATNPKALLFYAALFPPFVNPHSAFLSQLLVLAVTFMALFVAIGMVHALVGQRLKGVLSENRNARIANTVSGSIMIGAAVWMATK